MAGVAGSPGEPMEELMTGKGEPRLATGELREEVMAEPIMEGWWRGAEGSGGGGEALRDELSGLRQSEGRGWGG